MGFISALCVCSVIRADQYHYNDEKIMINLDVPKRKMLHFVEELF